MGRGLLRIDFSPRPLGERGDRKAEGAPRFASSGGEGVFWEQMEE
jgi:hypothetical protein